MPTQKPQILLVEDEPAQREVLAYNLEAEGYGVQRAADGEEAMLLIAESPPDLIILDWMMPLMSGLEVCRQLKSREATRAIPVIMLSARSEEIDTVRGLETGADDYVVKPYALGELMARVRTQLRRTRPGMAGQVLVHGDISLDAQQHRVTRGDHTLDLSPTEFQLLLTLMEQPGRVFSRDQLLDHVWGRDIYVDTRTVDVHIARLRKTLRGHGGDDPVRTVRGTGYALG